MTEAHRMSMFANGEASYPCSFVIFGATGHLSATKLLPALYALEAAGRLPAITNFIAFGRRSHDDAAWTAQMKQWLQNAQCFEPSVFDRFARRFSYVQGDLNDVAAFGRLLAELGKPKTGVCSNIVFYLAIKPADFAAVTANLAAVGLNRPRGLHRIVIEKPFGEDLRSAQTLNALLAEHFDERQIFRIDHYLGKETVQNLIVFRFANLLIEPLWNRNYIDHVQITVAESAGIETRADYYDRSGALRDMVQNHLLQLTTLVAMEPPAALEADALRDEKVKVLRAIRPVEPFRQVIRAQYAAGAPRWPQDANTADAPLEPPTMRAYREEADVAPDSATETFVALKLMIDNWRWRGVPFYLRTGKRMQRQRSFVALRFKHTPQQLFRDAIADDLAPNWIRLSLQPDERMDLDIQTRQPGLGMTTRALRINANYRENGDRRIEAYEALLLDIIRGDQTNFIRFDEVEWAWRVVDPILTAWKAGDGGLRFYPAGTDGPSDADTVFDWPYQRWESQG